MDTDGSSHNIFQYRADLTLYQHMGGYDEQSWKEYGFDIDLIWYGQDFRSLALLFLLQTETAKEAI